MIDKELDILADELMGEIGMMYPPKQDGFDQLEKSMSYLAEGSGGALVNPSEQREDPMDVPLRQLKALRSKYSKKLSIQRKKALTYYVKDTPKNPQVPGNSYFAECKRDKLGHCLPKDGAEESATEESKQPKTEGDSKETPAKNRIYAPPPAGETVTSAPCCLYDPDPTKANPETGVAEHARVGVPANQAPPPPNEIPRLRNLTEKEREVEGRFADAYLADPESALEKYRVGRNTVVGHDKDGSPKYAIGDAPHIFGTDDAKMLSPDYNPKDATDDDVKNNRGLYNAALHQTANAIAKRAFIQHLDDVVAKLPENERVVLVTSGGVAAGKGYALKNIPETRAVMDKAAAVWDAAGEQNATENPWVLAECKKRGIKAVFAYIHADPVNTWENPERGVVERAGKIGRMVDAHLFADSYAMGAKNFKAFHDNNRDDEHAAFFVVNNAKGGKPVIENEVPEAALAIDADQLRARASKVIEERADNLKPAVVRGGLIGSRIWGEPKVEAGQKSLCRKRR